MNTENDTPEDGDVRIRIEDHGDRVVKEEFEGHPYWGWMYSNALTVDGGEVLAVPKEDLRELVEEWREKYDEYDNDPAQIPNGGHQMMCKQINECADALEELIGDTSQD